MPASGAIAEHPTPALMFIVTRTATQCSAWVQISRHRGLFALDLRPLVDDADHADGERQKLPITNERLMRRVGVGDTCDREHQRNDIGEAVATEMALSPECVGEDAASSVCRGCGRSRSWGAHLRLCFAGRLLGVVAEVVLDGGIR